VSIATLTGTRLVFCSCVTIKFLSCQYFGENILNCFYETDEPLTPTLQVNYSSKMAVQICGPNTRMIKLTWCRLLQKRLILGHNSTNSISISSTKYTLKSSNIQQDTKVPQKPLVTNIDKNLMPPPTKIDLSTIQLLEKLSLVNFANAEGISRLEEAIRVADQLSMVNTDGVEPMISVLEEESLYLAEDEVTSGNMSEELLGCAAETLEDYFVVPPGNIDFVPSQEYYESLKDDS